MGLNVVSQWYFRFGQMIIIYTPSFYKCLGVIPICSDILLYNHIHIIYSYFYIYRFYSFIRFIFTCLIDRECRFTGQCVESWFCAHNLMMRCCHAYIYIPSLTRWAGLLYLQLTLKPINYVSIYIIRQSLLTVSLSVAPLTHGNYGTLVTKFYEYCFYFKTGPPSF